MWLFIEPTDVWLFRDGRAFDAGSDHRAQSVFPPYPTTLQGAIRSKVLALNGIDLTAYRRRSNLPSALIDEIGLPPLYRKQGEELQLQEEGSLGSFRMRGPFLARREAGGIVPYFPCPADLLVDKEHKKIVPLRPQRQPAFQANWPNQNLIPLEYESQEPAKEYSAWLSGRALERYLRGETLQESVDEHEWEVIPGNRLFQRENRFGVGITSGQKTTREGFLYQVEYIRPAVGVGLLVEVIGLREDAWEKTGILSIGGEARSGRYEVLPEAPSWPIGTMGDQGFKVYLATPTILGQGWQASDWGHAFQPKPGLVAAAVPRFRSIGGWDMAHNRQKGMRRYVSAGSVYYFESYAQPTGKPVCEYPTEASLGFGEYFTGRW